MYKYNATQELANIFPAWSKTRSDSQSIGYQVLNAFAGPMEKMTIALARMRKNFYLNTVNLDEIDLPYRVILPTNFEFDLDTSDPLLICPLPPTVSGQIGSDWYTISTVEPNTIEEFWYKTHPNRATLGKSEVIKNFELTSFLSEDQVVTGEFYHHIDDGGYLYVEIDSGVSLIRVEDGDLIRARVVLEGETRKGTEETETIIFPWPQKQKTSKEWKRIDKIKALDMPEDITISVRSGDFTKGPYIDFYNLEHSHYRRKIDKFWNLELIESHNVLSKVHYVSDQWEQLVLGFNDKESVQSWELLDTSMVPVSGVDLAVQPFTESAWIVGNDNRIHKYDLREEWWDQIDLLKGKTPGSHVQLEMNTDYLVKDETLIITPWHARPLKEIISYRIWYQDPNGDKFGILDGNPVAFSSNFTVRDQQLQRNIDNDIYLTLTERGEYLFVLEATFIDKVVHVDKRLVKVSYKQPLSTIDLSNIISENITGIEFDSDQKMWVSLNTGNYQEVNLHTDVMLIDYDNKIIYFKEEYDNVDIESNA